MYQFSVYGSETAKTLTIIYQGRAYPFSADSSESLRGRAFRLIESMMFELNLNGEFNFGSQGIRADEGEEYMMTVEINK